MGLWKDGRFVHGKRGEVPNALTLDVEPHDGHASLPALLDVAHMRDLDQSENELWQRTDLRGRSEQRTKQVCRRSSKTVPRTSRLRSMACCASLGGCQASITALANGTPPLSLPGLQNDPAPGVHLNTVVACHKRPAPCSCGIVDFSSSSVPEVAVANGLRT